MLIVFLFNIFSVLSMGNVCLCGQWYAGEPKEKILDDFGNLWYKEYEFKHYFIQTGKGGYTAWGKIKKIFCFWHFC